MAVAPLTAQYGVPAIFNAPVASVIKNNPLAFRSFTDFAEMCRQIGTYWRNQGINTAALLRTPSESGDICLEGVRLIYPEIIVAQFNPGDDLKPLLLRFRDEGVGGVLNLGLEPDLLNHLQALQTLRLPLRLGALDNMFNAAAIRPYAPVLPQVDAFGYGGIDEAFKLRLKDAPSSSLEGAALAYTHIRQLGTAVHKCPSRNANCQIEVLAKSPPDSASGFVGWASRVAQYKYRLHTLK
jgi:hypothetical protein